MDICRKEEPAYYRTNGTSALCFLYRERDGPK
jgi:hypothetical protein